MVTTRRFCQRVCLSRSRSDYKLTVLHTSFSWHCNTDYKFGLSHGGGSESHYQWRELFRNYVRDNALCVVAADFDTKSCKIRLVVLSVDDADAANKRYVQQSVQDLKNRLNEIKRKIAALQNNVQVMLTNLIRKVLNNYLQCLRNVCWLNCTFRREEIFCKDMYTDTMICDRQMLYMRFNRSYHYILTVIDDWVSMHGRTSLKVKSGNEVMKAKIIRDDRRCAKNLHTDRGKEFYNSDVQKFLKKHNINHYSIYSVMKTSIVEWFNHTLKNDMWKQFTHNGNYKWVDILPRLVSNYNARKYRIIDMRPVDITPAIVDRLLTTVYNRIKIAAHERYKVGDSVRVSKFKTVFDKDYTPNWSTVMFKIIKA